MKSYSEKNRNNFFLFLTLSNYDGKNYFTSDLTPNEFIQHIRLKKGVQLLEQGKINISEISYKLGFKTQKNFSRCFTKKFGIKAIEYIKTFSDF
ncbi:helix-turn-helix domain-containing protein [Flavobacterium faecale]|uniref:helix-turn-helix domain-containing protein n=1 Tax=Flavobacterium faecale TaxID=1355330 RepID=UPI003AACA451